jgi:hypothetical protein
MRGVCSNRVRLAVSAVVLVVLLAAPVEAAGRQPTLHYLAVGVSRYVHLPADSQLRFAHKDARDLAAVWSAQQGTLYVQVAGEILVDSQATRRGILEALARRSAQVGPGDLVMCSLSGHGRRPGILLNDWYFCPADFDPRDVPATGLPASLLRDRLRDFVRRGATVVLILDACYSGSVGIQEEGIVTLASCLSDEVSVEGNRWDNGVFTKALIEALEGRADLNRDQLISLAETVAYLSGRVAELLQEDASRRAQHPTCGQPPSLRSSLPLTRAGGRPTSTSGMAPATSGPPPAAAATGPAR